MYIARIRNPTTHRIREVFFMSGNFEEFKKNLFFLYGEENIMAITWKPSTIKKLLEEE